MFKLTFIMSLMILGIFVWADEPSDDCDACGDECKRFCGTKQFRLCCHNYMRRRRSADVDLGLAALAGMRRPYVPYSLDNVVQQLEEAVDQYQDNLAMRFI